MHHLLSLFTVLILFLPTLSTAQSNVTLEYYLPEEITYDETIPTPHDVLGTEVGQWHVRHDQLVHYMKAVAEASDRISIEEIGHTYEHRTQLLLTITSPENHANIEQLRTDHLKLSDPKVSDDLTIETMPAVALLGFSIHGNEPSGSNASLLVAYHLAAAQGEEIEALLSENVILVDPSFNPDGLNRFAHWANMHRGRTAVADPQSREHNEVFPGGRTNHYWFDLNRDWLLVQHPESQNRIAKFHQWLPNVLTDHHEMGTNSTFFFQPGIPSRTHPLTPQRNQDLTGEIAEYHAKAFDRRKELYYSKESFDDFYYGKGSTYPDINGSIGILFEQASSRGHAQESIHGVLRFPETIKNQFTAALSTMEAVKNMRVKLLDHQRRFYKEAADEAKNADTKAIIFGTSADQARTMHLAELLSQHQIELFKLKKSVSRDGSRYEAGKAYVIPTNQRQYKLITAVFEKRTTFEDSLFYDVSAFNLGLSFNMPYSRLDRRAFDDDLLGKKVTKPELRQGELVGGKSDYAYLFEWDEYYAPRALNTLMEAGVRVKVASKPFKANTKNGAVDFDYGTILVPLGRQQVATQEIHELMDRVAMDDGIDVHPVTSGLTPQGMDLGSRNFEDLDPVKVAIVVGDGVSSYEAGEAWHLLDQRYHMAPSLIDKSDFNRMSLDRYNVIVMVNGRYGDLSTDSVADLKEWVAKGNTLILTKAAVRWAKSAGLASVEYVTTDDESDNENTPYRPYSLMGRDYGAQVIGGTIFENQIDRTHPIGYGFNQTEIPVFRNSRTFISPANNAYATPLRYTDSPLLAGYVSDDNLEQLKGSAGIVISGEGRGKVISMVDNPNFRAFWYGTNKLFANAIFFGQTISGSSAER